MKNIYDMVNYSIIKLIRVLVFLILIIPFLYFNKFNQDQIDYIIHGNKIVDSDIIIGKMPIQTPSLKGINLINIKSVIEKDSYIKECSIRKINSSKIFISVNESKPIAKLLANSDTTILDYEGNFMQHKYNISLSNLNEIRVINTSIDFIDNNKNDLIKIIQFIKENDLLSDQFAITFDHNNIIAHDNEKAIKFGANHIRKKLENLKYFIKLYEKKYKTIDLYDKEYITASTKNKYGLKYDS